MITQEKIPIRGMPEQNLALASTSVLAIPIIDSSLAAKNTENQIVQEEEKLSIDTDEQRGQILTLRRENDLNARRIIYRLLTIISIVTGPLFSYFLFTAIVAASDSTREELDLEGKFWEILFTIIGGCVSSLSAIADFISVNPIEETEEMITSTEDKELLEKLMLCSPTERIIIKVYSVLNQIIANSTYLIASTSDAIVVAYIFSQTGVRWGLGIPLTGLGIIFYNMLNRAKVNEHAYEYIHRVGDCQTSMIIDAFRTPLISFELIIQVLMSSASRSALFAYIIDQLLTEFFGSENDHKNEALNGLILYAAISSFYSTIFSRTLNVRNCLFNPKFSRIPQELLESIRVSRCGIFTDVVMTGLRSGAACTLLYKYGSANIYINITLTLLVGSALTGQNLYCRYRTRLYQTALDIYVKTDLNVQPLLDNGSSEKLFDSIKELNKTEGLKTVASFFNLGERAARWCAFMGFLFALNKLLYINTQYKLPLSDLFCLQQIICNPTQENEFTFYQESIVDTLAYYRTKLQLSKDPMHEGSVFFKTKSEYPKSLLMKYLPRGVLPSQTFQIDNDSADVKTLKEERAITPQFKKSLVHAIPVREASNTAEMNNRTHLAVNCGQLNKGK